MQNTSMRVGIVQLEVGDDVPANVAAAEVLVRSAADQGARLVVLPEKWNAIGEPDALHAAAEAVDGPTLSRAAGWARELGIWLLAPLRRRATAGIAEVDERRRVDREQLQARLRGEKD